MSYDTPLSAQGQQLADLPFREQLRRGFRDMGSRSYSSAKNFGLIGAMFAGTECCIESVGGSSQRWLGYFKQLTFGIVSSKERLEERRICWLRHWRCPRGKSWSSGSRDWVRRFRCFQRSHRRFLAATD